MNGEKIGIDVLKGFGECLLTFNEFKVIDPLKAEMIIKSPLNNEAILIYQRKVNISEGIYLGIKVGSKKVKYTIYKSLDGQSVMFDDFLESEFEPVTFDESIEEFLERGMLEKYHNLYRKDCKKFGKINYENYNVYIQPKNK